MQVATANFLACVSPSLTDKDLKSSTNRTQNTSCACRDVQESIIGGGGALIHIIVLTDLKTTDFKTK